MKEIQFQINGKTISKRFLSNLYVGSHPSCDLHLPLSGISERQFAIAEEGSKIIIRSLSPNIDTRVNGTMIKEAYLKTGCEIEVSGYTFLFFEGQERPPSSLSDARFQSQSPIWIKELKKIEPFSVSPYPVFIQGPSGAGKEAIAERIHQLSPQCTGPLVKLNCSSFSESLVASELFGHRKGAFTGAFEDRKGAIEAAKGGTLFLDEIGDLAPPLQSKLLRLLENQEYRPVGSDQTLRSQCRFIFATHKDLQSLVDSGAFREDLYFRIHVLTLRVPSLRERIEDLESLVFQIAKELRIVVSDTAIQKMKSYEWPGNIRELKNFLIRSSLNPRRAVDAEDVDSLFLQGQKTLIPVTGQPSKFKDLEKKMILEKLLENKGNQRLTADQLGMPKSTLCDRLQSYGIQAKELKRNLKISRERGYKAP